METIKEESIYQFDNKIDKFIDNIIKKSLEINGCNTFEDGADKATRLTLAYLLKYNLLDLNKFVESLDYSTIMISKE